MFIAFGSRTSQYLKCTYRRSGRGSTWLTNLTRAWHVLAVHRAPPLRESGDSVDRAPSIDESHCRGSWEVGDSLRDGALANSNLSAPQDPFTAIDSSIDSEENDLAENNTTTVDSDENPDLEEEAEFVDRGGRVFRSRDHGKRYGGLMSALARYDRTHPEHRMPRDKIQPWLVDLVRVNGSNKQPPQRLYAWTPENVPLDSAPPLDDTQPNSDELPVDREHESIAGCELEFDSTLSSKPDESDSRRVYIIGAGNIGCLYATKFSQYPSPPPITLVVHRPELLRHWAAKPYLSFTPHGSDKPLLVSNINVELWSPEPPPIGPIREVADGRPVRRLLVATRAAEALPEVDRVRRYLSCWTTVLFAQNGVCRLWPPNGAHYVSLRYERCPDSRPNYGVVVTTHGVTSTGPFASRHASWASVVAGPVLPNDEFEPSTLDTGFLDMFATPELAGSVVPSWDLWTRQLDKLLINAIINPITAILRCKNGVLFEHASGPVHELMLALTFEIWLVYQRLIHRRAFHKLRTEYAGQIPLEERFEFDRMWAFLHEVGAQVKENTSSMLQHVLLGKSTEIREFNGWVVEMASLVGFAEKDVACNRKLIELVESGNVLTQEELSDELDLGAAKDRMWNTLGEKANFLLTGRYKRVSPAETPDQEHGVN